MHKLSYSSLLAAMHGDYDSYTNFDAVVHLSAAYKVCILSQDVYQLPFSLVSPLSTQYQ